MNDLPSFISESLSSELPPRNPILNPGWAGLAFDRNVHEFLAPRCVWVALFEVTKRRHPAVESVGGVSADDLRAQSAPTSFAPTLSGLNDFLVTDTRFLKDLFVFSPAKDWIVRLDQDVTLFAGKREVMAEVVHALGGLDEARRMMNSALDPGPDDRVGLVRFVDEITAPLQRR